MPNPLAAGTDTHTQEHLPGDPTSPPCTQMPPEAASRSYPRVLAETKLEWPQAGDRQNMQSTESSLWHFIQPSRHASRRTMLCAQLQGRGLALLGSSPPLHRFPTSALSLLSPGPSSLKRRCSSPSLLWAPHLHSCWGLCTHPHGHRNTIFGFAPDVAVLMDSPWQERSLSRFLSPISPRLLSTSPPKHVWCNKVTLLSSPILQV